MLLTLILCITSGLDPGRGKGKAGGMAVLSALLLLRLLAGQSAHLLSAGLQEVLSLLPSVQVLATFVCEAQS